MVAIISKLLSSIVLDPRGSGSSNNYRLQDTKYCNYLLKTYNGIWNSRDSGIIETMIHLHVFFIYYN